jgi:hypothetical protein
MCQRRLGSGESSAVTKNLWLIFFGKQRIGFNELLWGRRKKKFLFLFLFKKGFPWFAPSPKKKDLVCLEVRLWNTPHRMSHWTNYSLAVKSVPLFFGAEK